MKLLIISYYFIPSTAANAKRPFCIARGFLDAGWEVDVVSSCSFVPTGSSEIIKHSQLTIQRLQDPLILIRNKLSHNRFGRLVFASLRGALWPDITILWALRVARVVDISKYDRVLVSILPESMMVLGWIKRADFRWVFDYQETASPSYPGARRSPVYRWLMPLYTRLQRTVLKKTNHIIFATESYVRDYVRHSMVEKDRAVHIPFFYDDLSIPCTESKTEKFIISYFGQFQMHKGGRNPEVFLRALSLFLTRHPQARDLTEFRFYGRWIVKHNEFVSRAGLQDIVNINPAVPYDRYVELLSEASVLLLVASRVDNLFVPSKMLDYFGAHRPILGFVPPDSETCGILKEAKMAQYVSGETDVEGGARSLERLWQAWEERRPGCSFACAEQWSASVQVPRVVQLLSGLPSA